MGASTCSFAEFTIRAHDGLVLRGRTDRPPGEPRAHVLMVHGLYEHLGRYEDVTTALLAAGFCVHRSDLRGHGRSDGRRCYVRAFGDYLRDLALVLARVRAQAGDQQVFMVGHSYGGLIASRYLIEDSGRLAGAIISAPFLRDSPSLPGPGRALQYLISIAPWLRGSHPLKRNPWLLTRDPAYQEATRRDPFYYGFTTGSVLRQAAIGQAELRARAHEISVPILFIQGLGDEVVAPEGAGELMALVGSRDKELISYPGLAHELFHELEREQVFADVVTWLARHTAGRQPSVAPMA